VPTLVVVGDEDLATPRAKAERMTAAIAGARLEIVPGAGHSSTVEQPTSVTRIIEAFLAS
jgi:pimeloyl-ACP methyl ester carboxylesterase